MCAKTKSGGFELSEKVRKIPAFVVNTGFFMVAEAGLEPTTSGL